MTRGYQKLGHRPDEGPLGRLAARCGSLIHESMDAAKGLGGLVPPGRPARPGAAGRQRAAAIVAGSPAGVGPPLRPRSKPGKGAPQKVAAATGVRVSGSYVQTALRPDDFAW